MVGGVVEGWSLKIGPTRRADGRDWSASLTVLLPLLECTFEPLQMMMKMMMKMGKMQTAERDQNHIEADRVDDRRDYSRYFIVSTEPPMKVLPAAPIDTYRLARLATFSPHSPLLSTCR